MDRIIGKHCPAQRRSRATHVSVKTGNGEGIQRRGANPMINLRRQQTSHSACMPALAYLDAIERVRYATSCYRRRHGDMRRFQTKGRQT